MNLRMFKILYQSWWRGKPPNPPFSHLVQVGDPILRLKANPVDKGEINSHFMQQLYRKLSELMKKTGACGISAPQLGISLRVFAIQFPALRGFSSPVLYEQRQMEYIPFQIWVNPEMKILDYEKVVFDEGCESMKGFVADVPRYKKVLLTGLNENGETKSWEAAGWSARIVQHEMEHLEGKFFTDTMDSKTLTCTCWDDINRKEGRIFITYIPGK